MFNWNCKWTHVTYVLVLYYIVLHVIISTFISDDRFYIYVYRFIEGTKKWNENTQVTSYYTYYNEASWTEVFGYFICYSLAAFLVTVTNIFN
jgi:hypothetical protein